jgi:hypothetical protein
MSAAPDQAAAPPLAPALPTLAEKVAAVDAVEVASRIMAQGSRAAIRASTVEIIALADQLIRLSTLADITFELLTLADRRAPDDKPDQVRALNAAVVQQISDVGAALEALGYSAVPGTTPEVSEAAKEI